MTEHDPRFKSRPYAKIAGIPSGPKFHIARWTRNPYGIWGVWPSIEACRAGEVPMTLSYRFDTVAQAQWAAEQNWVGFRA